ncbi:pyridoxal phosphate phosphatase PHOSPHO2 isoform 3-T4 [Aulostomus maculatus]
MKTLMVFDFDHTVVDDNSDTWVIRCLPGQTLPDNVKNSYRKGHWTEFMGRVMNYIGDQEVSPDRVRSVMETIPFTAGMADLLTFISEQKNAIDCIIISDANTMFIDWILHAAGLQAAVDRVFTNPAKFNDLGYMEVIYEFQWTFVPNWRKFPRGSSSFTVRTKSLIPGRGQGRGSWVDTITDRRALTFDGRPQPISTDPPRPST